MHSFALKTSLHKTTSFALFIDSNLGGLHTSEISQLKNVLVPTNKLLIKKVNLTLKFLILSSFLLVSS